MSKSWFDVVNINQGDVLLVVGSTGLATGAHVCYRFGKWEASCMLKLKLPGGEPMKSANSFF
jgi:murein DD-endopeptidase MepM/ murein hydrolase activator NlpD